MLFHCINKRPDAYESFELKEKLYYPMLWAARWKDAEVTATKKFKRDFKQIEDCLLPRRDGFGNWTIFGRSPFFENTTDTVGESAEGFKELTEQQRANPPMSHWSRQFPVWVPCAKVSYS